jgi:Uma2 family endonuclease
VIAVASEPLASIIHDVPGAIETSDLHRFSLDEYHQLIESGGLDEDTRVELIDGLIVEMSPKTAEHEKAVLWLTERLARNLDWDRYQLGASASMTLEKSEPEPDFIVVARDTPRPYHPSTAALVIEVSVSSLRRDLVRKHELYARAGVPEYWVVDIHGGRVVVHRGPREGAYEQVSEVRAGGALASQVLPGVELAVDELFAAAGACRT